MGSRPPDERDARRARQARRRDRLRGARAHAPGNLRFASRWSPPATRRRGGGGPGRLRQGISRTRPLPRRLPFRPWLLRIVANEARNRRRSAGRRAGLALRAAAAASGDAAPSPEAAALAHERRESCSTALGRLDERDRDVLVHRFLLELGEEETAAALGCPPRDGEVAHVAGARAAAGARRGGGRVSGSSASCARSASAVEWPDGPDVAAAVAAPCRRAAAAAAARRDSRSPGRRRRSPRCSPFSPCHPRARRSSTGSGSAARGSSASTSCRHSRPAGTRDPRRTGDARGGARRGPGFPFARPAARRAGARRDSGSPRASA